VVFAPLFAGCVLTHRLKLTDGQNPQSVLNLDYETIRFTSADGLELAGWFIPHENNYRTVIICHGAGANKGNFAWFLVAVAEHANVLMFDFRAHGASDGRVTTYGISEKNDVIGAVDWLKANRPDGSESIIGLGSSQGALALALAAAEDQRIDAVILDSPFVSPRELAHHHADRLPVAGPFMADVVLAYMSLLSGADFFDASAERAVQAMGDRPLLVIHGDEDFAMPAAHARRIHRAAAGPATLWLGPGPHSNIVTTAPDAYESRVAAFIAVVDPLQAYRHEDSVLKCLGSTSPP
jgi:pimeloyl-ACP methyl ester carboxylesterase